MSPSCTFAPFFTVGTNFHFFFLSMGSATTPLLIMSPLCCLIFQAASGSRQRSTSRVLEQDLRRAECQYSQPSLQALNLQCPRRPGSRQCPQRVGLLLRSTLHLLPSRHQTSSLPSCPRLRLQGQIF